ncbi:hypothetical protein Desaci_1963 [Desulfosporosinus acidiphilus SJ4]|uniref:Uncharacterized protein n=1 Tax=Desulfosporosinus acidiphilus (strain DSM 22704 / JCM 16185 / SJ4) TaxID=646529 RepID=I4D566_DESAJ|nr:hypothetical protein [Desulfosporosinus acidiphilus]AFM40940.1 hypothetical protein Desaci_1963 [Desulfosporosinus acidiphilus SJ4]
MIVRWERDDLTELIKELMPAHLELETLSAKRIYFFPNLENTVGFAEAVISILMTFFLNNSHCSLLIVQADEEYNIDLNIYRFLITREPHNNEIVLSYKVLPENFLPEYFY